MAFSEYRKYDVQCYVWLVSFESSLKKAAGFKPLSPKPQRVQSLRARPEFVLLVRPNRLSSCLEPSYTKVTGTRCVSILQNAVTASTI